ncbi:hypothetical protein K1719_002092 [Acacia pycnantha]|nr:hypothetical protein K1719_002092 [Acacia pycnantha]
MRGIIFPPITTLLKVQPRAKNQLFQVKLVMLILLPPITTLLKVQKRARNQIFQVKLAMPKSEKYFISFICQVQVDRGF